MKAFFLFFILLFPSIHSYGSYLDDEPLKTILSSLERFKTGFPQEKVHLHLDKPYYSIGDTIWFKAYVVNAEKNQPSTLSKIIYVELINDKDSIKQSLRLQLSSGLSQGDFTLSDTLKEGNYRIRAYTNWMRNFNDEYFFDKTIRIGNILSTNLITETNYIFSKEGNNEKVLASIAYRELDGKPLARKEVTYNVQLDFRNIVSGKGITDDNGILKVSFVNTQPFILKSGKITTRLKLDDKVSIDKIIPVKATTDEMKIQFFPEGGQLINGIKSKIAFKAVKADGFGIDASGYIIDKDNNKVTEFKTAYAGMGSFVMRPLSGNTYKAVIQLADGSEKRFDLPKATQEGYVLAIDKTNTDSLLIKIAVSQEILNAGGEVTLVAQTNHVISYIAKTKLTTAILTTSLPAKRFPTGILQLTLFSSENQPVAERLVYIQHKDQLRIAISTNKSSYSKRQKVQMNLQVTNAEGKPVEGNFSLAVTNNSVIPYNELYNTTIFSNLLLSSDLRGYIEAPDYYFTDINDDKERQLDNLMLTQGWRRFNWKNILNDSYPSITFKPEQSIEINGIVTTGNHVPVAGGKVTLYPSSGNGVSLDTLTNAEGGFRFNNLFFNDSTKFVIEARNQNGRSNVEIELAYTRPPLVTRNRNAPDAEVNVNRSMLEYLKDRQKQFNEMRLKGFLRKSIVLAEVKVTEQKPLVKNSSNLNGAGNADVVIKSEQLQNCANLAQCLSGKVAGLIFKNGVPYLTRNDGPMLVVLDGMDVNPQFIYGINVSSIESIELLKSATSALYGMKGVNGVFIITSKKGEMKNTRGIPGTISYIQQGYYMGRQFYSPDYDIPKTSSQLTDRRTTVYWNPTIITNAEGKATIEFFNSDNTGSYNAIIEGLNSDGKLGREIYRYTVQ